LISAQCFRVYREENRLPIFPIMLTIGALIWSRRKRAWFLGWGPFAVELCLICGAATNKGLTRPVTCPQPYLSVNL
jgi:hypothetical protein